MKQNYWHDKSVVITGGARGQGAAEVLRLLREGAWVYAADVLPFEDSSWAELREQAAEWTDKLHVVHLDVSCPASWEALAQKIQDDEAKLYGLVNNAGITLRKTVTKTSLEEWDKLIGINLTGTFLGIRTLAPIIQDGGSIVNISSTAGLTGYFSAAYCASKWGVLGLTRSAAQELASRKIRVNSVCPGLVETPMVLKSNAEHDAAKAKAFFEGNRNATLLSRGANPDEIAAAVVFLLGPDASFITGADLPVDGGMTGGGIYWRIGKATGNL